MAQLVVDAAEVPNGRESAFIEDVRGVRGDDELRVEQSRVIVSILKEAQNVPDEDLLDLRVQMRLRLLNEDQMKRSSLVILGFPLLVQVEQLNHHVDQILEPQAIVAVWQLGGSYARDHVVNLGVLPQDSGRIQGRPNHDLRIVDARIAELGQAREGVIEDFLQVEVQLLLRGI